MITAALVASLLFTPPTYYRREELKAKVNDIALGFIKKTDQRVRVLDTTFSVNLKDSANDMAIAVFAIGGKIRTLLFIYENGEWAVYEDEFR